MPAAWRFVCGLPYYVFNFSDEFRRQVMDRFADAYGQGRTPNPCIDCNRYLKFRHLYDRAALLGCDTIATGHYARIERENGRYLLKKALDASKDQSYVLYMLTQEQLAHTQFPLGSLHKAETRAVGGQSGLFQRQKAGQSGHLFRPGWRLCRFHPSALPEKRTPPVTFVDESGRILGTSQGHHPLYHRPAERTWVSLSIEPLYVKAIDPKSNQVVLSGNDALFSRQLTAGDFQLDRLGSAAPPVPVQCQDPLPPDGAAL